MSKQSKKSDFPEPLTISTEQTDDIKTLPEEFFFLGRRSDFNHTLVDKMKQYLDKPLYEDITDLDGKLIKRVPTEMPSIVGLALEIGVHRKTIEAWNKKYSHFADYVELLKQKQKRWLLYHGLNKNIDSNFGKFVAINCTDMTDKKEHAITTEKIEINIDSDDAKL